MYRDCRKKAGKSLLDASLMLNVCRERIIKIEYLEEEPHPDLVLKMCNEYGCGARLAAWHCANVCSLKCLCDRHYAELAPALAGIRLLNAMDGLKELKDKLIQVLDDGLITRDELPIVEKILDRCNHFHEASMALKIEAERVKEKPSEVQLRRC